MGFQYEQVFKLSFEDPSMAGFECQMREPSVNELLDITELLFDNAAKLGSRERVTRRTELLAACITEWDLEDRDGVPLPVCADSILRQGRGFSVQLTAAWLREVVGLTAPPASPAQPSDSSDDGLSSALAELPMQIGDEPGQT